LATGRHGLEALQARLDRMIAEFRAARQRRLVKQHLALWEREAAQRALASIADTELPPTKIN